MNVFDERSNLITLYTSSGTRDGATLAIILAELKLPYHLHLVNSPEEIHDIAAIPPDVHKTLPMLTDIRRDGKQICLGDVDSIAQYLVDQYDPEHLLSYPKREKDDQVKHWLAFLAQSNASDVPFPRKALTLYLHLEQHLQKAKTRYIVGKKCTLADVVFFPAVAASGSAGFDLERFPELTSWYNRLSGQPAIVRGMEAVHLNLRRA